jgi:hypothetical protein
LGYDEHLSGRYFSVPEPVKSSLKELEIIALGGTNFKHDGTSLDLSAFGVPWKVTISSILAIQPSVSDQSGVRLYQLLPISIKELKVKSYSSRNRFSCINNLLWFRSDSMAVHISECL